MSGMLRVMDGVLTQGAVVGDGRYRLIEPVGTDERDKAHLWRALDGRNGNDVALTILSGGPTDAITARHTLERAAPASRFVHPGIAPVLSVLSVGDGVAHDEGITGIVAAEWTRGTTMTDVVARDPVPPLHACLLLEPLADAVGLAHRRGVMLGVGHPLRIRVTPEGTLRLAFPGPPAGASLIDDVHGLGAILYYLLTGAWPAPGILPSPQDLHPEIPAELSDVAIRSLAHVSTDGIRTSDSILRVIRQVVENPEPVIALTVLAEQNEVLPTTKKDRAEWTTKPPVNDAKRKKKLAIAVAILVFLSICVFLWIGSTVIGTFL
jgi:hypothetical protein